jgi:sugar phosphate isomerase/epimerase
MPRPLALTLESLQLPLRAGLTTAARLGARGLAFSAVGPLAPEQLSATGRREVRHLFAAAQLQLPALHCPLRHGLDELEGLERRLERLRAALQLGRDLGAGCVTLAAGVVPADVHQPTYLRLRQAVGDLARWADRIGTRLALLAGGEPVARLVDFVRGLDLGCVGLTVDPALLLTHQLDPVDSLRTAGELLALFVARDARPRRLERDAQEVNLGAGDVDWFAVAAVLEEIRYQGWVVTQRGPTPDPSAAAAAALAFLKRLGL